MRPATTDRRRPLGRAVAAATALAAAAAVISVTPAQAMTPPSAPTSTASTVAASPRTLAPTAATGPTTGASSTLHAAPARRWVAPWTTTLRRGDRGPQVRAAQLRLIALGYWLDGVDNQFGSQTEQAVLALQKAERIARTGKIDPATTAALTRGNRPRGRTTRGSVLEVDIKRQIVLLVVDGRTAWVLNTSTGSGRYYVSQGVRSLARTPRGRFTLYRQIDGRRVAPLGVLYRPKYFYGGYAIHGSSSIPAFPASHGCVRVSSPAISWLWSSGIAPIGRRVWIY